MRLRVRCVVYSMSAQVNKTMTNAHHSLLTNNIIVYIERYSFMDSRLTNTKETLLDIFKTSAQATSISSFLQSVWGKDFDLPKLHRAHMALVSTVGIQFFRRAIRGATAPSLAIFWALSFTCGWFIQNKWIILMVCRGLRSVLFNSCRAHVLSCSSLLNCFF